MDKPQRKTNPRRGQTLEWTNTRGDKPKRETFSYKTLEDINFVFYSVNLLSMYSNIIIST